MMNILRTIILLCLTSLLPLSAKAQWNHVTDSLVEKFEQYQSNTLQEKIYVHIDRTSYLAGELLWFKIYYVDASFYLPLNVSKVAYVEILDKNNEPVIQEKVELKNGKGEGSLFIPAVLGSGNYVLRAYTNWMKNFSPEFYFHQPVLIINTFVKTEIESSSKSGPAFNARFFPEGGHLVSGVKAKIAFQVTSPDGVGIPCKGYVRNSSDSIVAEFQPLKFGIGHFYMTALAEEKYRISIEDENGNKNDFPFPEVKSLGYAMAVTETPDHIEIDVTARSANSPLVFLFAHSKQQVTKAEGKILTNDRTRFIISKDELREGITNLTLFNSELEPICERLFFKLPQKKLEFNIQSERKGYNPKNLVKLNLTTNHNSDISISVYRTDSIPSPQRNNIYEYLWLSSDLKGTVESPHYYFNSTDSIAPVALDNLMLTHGWRRFNWDTILGGQIYFDYLPEYRGHLIHGNVVNNANTPVAGVLTSLSFPDKTIQLYGSRSNSKGDVFFEVKNFFGNQPVYVQPMFAADSNLVIKINSPFSLRFASIDFPKLQLNPGYKETILNRSIAMQLHNIYYQERLIAAQNSTSGRTPFYEKSDELYMLDDYTRFPLLEEVFKEYVRGVMLRKRKEGIQFMVQQKINQPISTESPLVLLDGVPVFNYDKLLEFNANHIKKIEVLTHEHYLGPLVLHGAILLSTYNGDLGGFEINTENASINYEGLQLKREFYSPGYETQIARESRVPDQRSVLYWNASQQINAQSNTPIQFYTSDLSGEFEFVVEGISKDGVAGSAVYRFVVEENN